MAVKTPMIRLHRIACAGSVRFQEDLHSVVIRRLPCNPKGFWKKWREDVLRLHQDWRISAKELVLSATLKCAAAMHKVRVLVDTGAKIPLVFRRGLLAGDALRKATFPVQFSMVDGQNMEGGSHGIFVELRLPVNVAGRLIDARTVPLFAYEANIHGIDVIVGYPFLKVFNLSVDTMNDRLVLGTRSQDKASLFAILQKSQWAW